MLGKRAMQTARKPQFELPGIFLQAIRLMDLDSLFQRCFQPCFFCVLCIRDRAFDRFAAGNAARQVRIRDNKSPSSGSSTNSIR